jgi:hypothetical protein
MSHLEKALVGDQDPLEHSSLNKNDLIKEGVAQSTSSGELEYVPDTIENERKLTWKLDFKVIPIFGLLYLICFLDRTNIANAKIGGLVDGLNLPPTGYNTALWIFYIPFVLAEVPSNMFMSLSWVRPNYFLGTQTFILGKHVLRCRPYIN